ncbi:hypothetical protein [Tunturiibacter gelidoferens]|uniref:Uncharacterized protein n=2 Tax=Tunturiibacter gelidiferens TaxID=3069689 RepID=A0AAU7Z3L6_9BACT|nr:hypothetical protein [Edaphobacter lichenicola]MBB5340493.1 hypothetical protein [Edaphobacter lichenicola]
MREDNFSGVVFGGGFAKNVGAKRGFWVVEAWFLLVKRGERMAVLWWFKNTPTFRDFF